MIQSMRKIIICVIGLLGSPAMVPAACKGCETFCCPPFPLTASVEVGHHWTYSIMEHRSYTDDEDIARIDSTYCGTQSITVIGRLKVKDHIYFELGYRDVIDSDGRAWQYDGLYRVDKARRMWQFDTGTSTEKLLWDIWGPPVDDALRNRKPVSRYIYYEEAGVKEIIANGQVWPGLIVVREGPFERHEWDWLSVSDTIKVKVLDKWQEDERITELYAFSFTAPEMFAYSIIAPNFGVLYCGTWEGWASDGVGQDYTLESYEQVEVSTVLEDVSFGQLKERVPRPASKLSRIHRE